MTESLADKLSQVRNLEVELKSKDMEIYELREENEKLKSDNIFLTT